MANIFDGVWKRLPAAATWLETWIVPLLCAHCGLRRWKNLPLCRRCLRELRSHREAEADAFIEFAGLRALFRMSPPLRSLVHGFKYRHRIRHIRFLCAHLRRSPELLLALGQADAFVPVPLHPARRRERGYNQAEWIAREVSRLSGNPMVAGVLRRVKSTSTQTKLGEKERNSNLSGAFRCSPGTQFQGKRLLLIDDVFTTGSTLNACRDELLRAGALAVEAFVLARVEKRLAEGEGFEPPSLLGGGFQDR